MSISKWVLTAAAVALIAGQASADHRVTAGTIKSINADKKTFVLTDAASKEWTMTLDEAVLVNRGGKEVKSGSLKEGDGVHVCYDKGITARTAMYILVREGDTKNGQLVGGKIKSFDKEKKEVTITDQDSKDFTYPVGDAKVRINSEESKLDEVKVGNQVILILDGPEGKTTLKNVIVYRK